ncbi:hypothetical protein BCR44DRAFT_81792 [Catenaria anguillulae PL171]|uniref:PH domain-containing protein n=1 Tax=Catenaria anguillulae PL171 TaxID=765915 RepID=A0A1Y2H3Z2_9FUNG|nr:hypothetical protein BCR44DRAFT_81792 [Catenaria anguillulae PL171]
MAPPPSTTARPAAPEAAKDTPATASTTAAGTAKKTTASRTPRPHPERPSPLKHLAMRRGSNGDMQQFLRRRSSASSGHRSAMALALANLEAQRAGVKALPDHYRKRARAQYSKSRKQLLVASITSSVLSRLEAARRKAEEQEAAAASAAAQTQVTLAANPPSQPQAVPEKPLPPTPPGAHVSEQASAAVAESEADDSEYTDVSESSETGSACSSAWYSPTASESEYSDDLSDEDNDTESDADSEKRATRAIRTTLRSNKDYDPTRPVVDAPAYAGTTQTTLTPTAADMLVAGHGLHHQPQPGPQAPPSVQVYALPAAELPSEQSQQLPPPPHRRSSLVATLSRRISLAPYQPANPLTSGASPSTFLPPAPLPEHPEQSVVAPPAHVPMTHPIPVLPTHPAAAAAPEPATSLSANPSPTPSSASSLNTQPSANGSSERQVRAAALKSILSRRTSNPPQPTHPFPPLGAVAPAAAHPHAHVPGLIADPPIVRSHPPSATLPGAGSASVAAARGPLVFPSPPPMARTTRSPSLPHLFAMAPPQRSSTLPSPLAAANAHFPATRSRSMSIPTCLLAGRRKKAPPPPLNLEGLTESFTRDMGKVKQVVRNKSLAELEEERAKKGFPRVSEAPEAFRKEEQAADVDTSEEGPASNTERRPSLVKTINVRPQKGLVASPESFADESSAAEDAVAPPSSIAPSAAGESEVGLSSATSSTVPLPVSLTRPPVVVNDPARLATVHRSLHPSASMGDLHLSSSTSAVGGIQAMLSPRAFHFSGALQVLTDDKSAWLKRHLTFDGRLLTCLAPCYPQRPSAPHLAAAPVATASATTEWTLDVSKIVLLALVSKRPAAPSPPTTTTASSSSGGDAWKLAFTISTAHADRVLRATSHADLSNWMYVLGRAREMVQLQATVANLMATVREQQGREVRHTQHTHALEDRGVKRPTTDPTGRGMLSPVRVLPQNHHYSQHHAPAPTSVAVKAVASSLNRPPPIVTSAAAVSTHAGVGGVRESMVASIVSTTASPESDFSFRSPMVATPAGTGTGTSAGASDLGPRPVPVQLPGGAPQSARLDMLVAELTNAVELLDPSVSPPPSLIADDNIVPAATRDAQDTISRVLDEINGIVGQVAGLDAFVSATRASWTAGAQVNQGRGSEWVADDGHAARLRALARMVSDWPRVIVGASPDKKPQAASTVKYAATGAVADSAVSVGVVVDAAQ